ncbi:MAG: hypothetical protein IKO43_05780 [Kiritimatiellae bacterium]|nr:hypothetical protein [Kiritimatiellia bacterium]
MKVTTKIAVAAAAASGALCALAAFGLPALTDDEFLEESVLNEVEHALARAPADVAPPPAAAATNDVFGISGLSATEQAIRLVSAQRADGRWLSGTNDVTAVAVDILSRLAPEVPGPNGGVPGHLQIPAAAPKQGSEKTKNTPLR